MSRLFADAERARGERKGRAERGALQKQLTEQGLALAMEKVAHAKTKLALEDAERAVGDVFENLDLNSLNRSLDEARAERDSLKTKVAELEREAMETTAEQLRAGERLAAAVLAERKRVVNLLKESLHDDGCGADDVRDLLDTFMKRLETP